MKTASTTAPRSAEQALIEAVAFLQGVGDKEPAEAAAYIVEQLALRGFSGQPISSPILNSHEPMALRQVRSALGITRRSVAEEAGVSAVSLSRAEHAGSRSHQATLQMIGDALVRLGARRPALSTRQGLEISP